MTISTTTKGNKTIKITKDEFGYYRAIIAQTSDVNDFGDVLAVKELKTLAGIAKWVNSVIA